VIIFLCGVTYLYLNVNFIIEKGLSWKEALWVGFLVFLPGDILKVTAASVLATKLRKLV
jgi:biotin transport system substrate-specific component